MYVYDNDCITYYYSLNQAQWMVNSDTYRFDDFVIFIFS